MNSRIIVLVENKLIKEGVTMRTMALMLLVALTVAGCASFRAVPDTSAKKFNEIADRNPRWADARQLINKYNLDKMSDQYDNQPEPVKKEFRNNYINAHILVTDLVFEDFQHELGQGGVFFNLATDVTQLALTGATAVVPIKETKTILSAIATGIGGAKGSLDKNLFFKQTMEVLLVKMKANRAEVLTGIQEKLIKVNTTKYPLTAAILDLEAYHRAGTLPQALISIMEKSADTIKKSEEATKTNLGLPKDSKVNLNTASKEDLEKLFEPGPVKAQEIIEGRPYKKIEDVMKVKGIKEDIFEKIKDNITVN